MTTSQPNILQPRRSRTAIRTLEENISRTNALSTSDFADAYFPPGWSTWTHPKTQEVHTLTLHSPDELEEADFQACFELIDQTSGDDYRNSSAGWSDAGKKKEMKSHGLRYVLVRRASSPTTTTTTIEGFTSFMPTFEDGQPVLYIYEIHLCPSLQGSGLGSRLIREVVRPVAARIGHLDKVMLTCFRSNEAGRRFYDRLGFGVDESSPEDRRLRGGRVVTSDYVILSWRIAGGPLGHGGLPATG